jgi:lauroyl/myristoyl acyltransferase
MTIPLAEPTSGRMTRLLDRWRLRPARQTPSVWTLLILLDYLPWPWGEDVLAGLFMVIGLLRPSRRRAALRWARLCGTDHPWRLAARLCAFVGRWVARMRTLGFRSPDDLRANVMIEGAEHLAAAPGAAILLGFHLGPSDGDLTFRVLGHPVTLLGGSNRGATMTWWSEEWHPFVQRSDLSFAGGDRDRWLAVLYTGRRILLDGEKVYILADGEGREAFKLHLSVGEMSIKAGWVTLHQLTRAPVLPVLRRLEGHRQVVTIHPPLPALTSESPDSLDECRDYLARLVEDYIRKFPEQCPHLGLIQSLAYN